MNKVFLTIILAALCAGASGNSTTGVGDRFRKANIFDICHALPIPAEMQQFDMDDAGNIYYAHVGYKKAFYEVVINKTSPCRKASEGIESMMKLYYAGHPTSMDVEQDKDGKVYIWIPEYAQKIVDREDGPLTQYWGCRAFARIPYQPGAELFPWDESIEYFFAGSGGDINLSVDFEHDVLCVTYHKPEYEGRTRRMITYRLSEALALPLTECRLRPLYYGGDGAPDEQQTYVEPVIKAHDLRNLTPLAEFGVPTDRSMDINIWSWQGFEYYDGLVYFYEGTSANKGMGNSRAALTIFDMEGNIVEKRTIVDIAQNVKDLVKFDITETGTMEPEGVKVWKGALYLGFANGGYHGDKHLRCNIFKYKLPKHKSAK